MSLAICAAACRSAEKNSAQDASVPAVIDDACDRLRAKNLAKELAARASEPACVAKNPIATVIDACQQTPSGAIGLRLAQVHAVPGTSEVTRCDADAEIDLVHISGSGVVTKTSIGEPVSKDDPTNFENLNGWKWNMLGAPTFFDFDGDGNPEILVAGVPAGAGADEWQGLDWHEAWTFHRGKWLKYAPLAQKKFSSVEDVDQDGRPDLRTRGPYESVTAISGMPTEAKIIDPIFLLHSLPNGDFSSDDAVAKKFAATNCADALSLPFRASPQAWKGSEARSIVCARLHGQGEAELMKKIATTCKGYFDSLPDQPADRCPIWAKELAAITPPFTIP